MMGWIINRKWYARVYDVLYTRKTIMSIFLTSLFVPYAFCIIISSVRSLEGWSEVLNIKGESIHSSIVSQLYHPLSLLSSGSHITHVILVFLVMVIVSVGFSLTYLFASDDVT